MISRILTRNKNYNMLLRNRAFSSAEPSNAPPVRVAVTGAAGNIAYSILYRIASGEFLGK